MLSSEHVVSIPTSSVPVERLFRVVGKVFRRDRYRLKDSIFEKIAVCKIQLSIDYSFSKCCQLTSTLPVKMHNVSA